MTNYSIENSDVTMEDSAKALSDVVVGHKIVKVEKPGQSESTVITLDNGTRVVMREEADCCAYAELEAFLLHPELVDHIITGVGTTDNYSTWHIYADMGDVLELTVGWSEGSGYYAYGFDVKVEPIN